MIGFKQFTFICLDFPNHIAENIRKIRRKVDPAIAWKPVVVTLAGSSGCGHLSADQDILKTHEVLAEICRKTDSFDAQFSGIGNFKNTDIYFFEFTDETPFFNLQSRLADSNLKFAENPYPFKPHCTVHFKSNMTIEKMAHISNIEIPDEPFTFSQISLISDYTLMSRFSLSAVTSTTHF